MAADGAEKLMFTTPEFAMETCLALPASQQNPSGLNKKLKELGYEPVAKSSFWRWKRKVIKPLPKRQVIEAAPFKPTIDAVRAAEEDLKSIPSELVDALGGPRLLIVAKGQGLDRVENAIATVADAIAGRAKDIAQQLLAVEREEETVEQDGETIKRKRTEAAQAAKNAIMGLSTLAGAMHQIAASRTLFSVAHRNFAEGDRLSGEGEKFKAEAEVTRHGTQAEGAKVINQVPGANSVYEPGVEDEAIAAMREVESRK